MKNLWVHVRAYFLIFLKITYVSHFSIKNACEKCTNKIIANLYDAHITWYNLRCSRKMAEKISFLIYIYKIKIIIISYMTEQWKTGLRIGLSFSAMLGIPYKEKWFSMHGKTFVTSANLPICSRAGAGVSRVATSMCGGRGRDSSGTEEIFYRMY